MQCRNFLVFGALIAGTAVAQPDASGSSDYQGDRQVFEQYSDMNPFAFSLYKSNYVLPFSHSSNVTNPIIPFPERETKHTELVFQLSFKLPLFSSLFTEKTKLYFAYTQLTFWQLYTEDPFIRETNYEPEIFITHQMNRCSKFTLGMGHESNGRGGLFERTWNRLYLDYHVDLNPYFWFSAQPWLIVFKSNSSSEHNPDIGHFLGYDQFIFGLNVGRFIANLRLSNIESGFSRGQRELNVGYRMGKWHLFGQVFSGYGHSLLEYNHSTTAFGLGIALNV
ncbi:MAG TPA: phospholipase A [Gammaproteobacteria bacterium]|nr:phospholipase A [Gammaproteobacteria bacterium]